MSSVQTLVRNRIVETRTVPAEELRLHPYNWRNHPQGQIEAVEGILEEVGIVQTLVAYHSEREGGALTLIDGHLRKGLGGAWPVTITDLTDEEADLMLAVLHPIGDMATLDSERLGSLLQHVQMEALQSESLQELLIELAQKTPASFDDGNASKEDDDEDEESDYSVSDFTADQIGPHVRMVQLFFNEDNIVEFNRMTLALAKRYETTTLTETVMEAVKREHDSSA
jgi:hypothetical protein